MAKTLILGLLILFSACVAQAKLITQTVDYPDGDTVLQGYLAYDDSFTGKRPGVLVVHEWNGLGKYVQSRCEQLAKLGYVAFGADIYGKGVRPEGAQACMAESSKYKKDRALLRERANAGLTELKNNALVDPAKIAAIGYCFGGGTVLELARSGAPVAGVVSFHGNLDTPNPEDAKAIKGKVLVCQGGADTFTLSALPDFKKEMQDAKVDCQIITYPGAVHGFTNPDNKGEMQGVKYDAHADHESWKAMLAFFKKIFNS
jgi:dienelactone hydrolase